MSIKRRLYSYCILICFINITVTRYLLDQLPYLGIEYIRTIKKKVKLSVPSLVCLHLYRRSSAVLGVLLIFNQLVCCLLLFSLLIYCFFNVCVSFYFPSYYPITNLIYLNLAPYNFTSYSIFCSICNFSKYSHFGRL